MKKHCSETDCLLSHTFSSMYLKKQLEVKRIETKICSNSTKAKIIAFVLLDFNKKDWLTASIAKNSVFWKIAITALRHQQSPRGISAPWTHLSRVIWDNTDWTQWLSSLLSGSSFKNDLTAVKWCLPPRKAVYGNFSSSKFSRNLFTSQRTSTCFPDLYYLAIRPLLWITSIHPLIFYTCERRLHPGQVACPSQDHTEANETHNHPRSLRGLI